MISYSAPGVYIEDGPEGHRILPHQKQQAAFVGLTMSGPPGVPIGPLVSFDDYVQVCGPDPSFGMAPSVRGFFENGGAVLHVVRINADRLHVGKAYRRALDTLKDLTEVGVMAAPTLHGHVTSDAARRISAWLVESAQHSGAFALLDPPEGLAVSAVREYRASFDSSFAALYYPWVWLYDAEAGGDLLVPPSGLVAGVFARTDRERGVHKAPANAELHGVAGYERELTTAHQEVLNPIGVNCLRTFEGRGHRVWGARTLSSDPEWKYVNVRRYVSYVERSIENGTQWAVFEPNDAQLWAALRSAIGDFLLAEWRRGALQGTTSDQAFFVRCDRTTMTQADIDMGGVIMEIGIAPVKPAEFMIIRIAQLTANP